jgi:hypothetical protein
LNFCIQHLTWDNEYVVSQSVSHNF